MGATCCSGLYKTFLSLVSLTRLLADRKHVERPIDPRRRADRPHERWEQVSGGDVEDVLHDALCRITPWRRRRHRCEDGLLKVGGEACAARRDEEAL